MGTHDGPGQGPGTEKTTVKGRDAGVDMVSTWMRLVFKRQ